MDGQMLGGGVIVLVAVVLWLAYLLPSWYNRYQYDAAERDAVRLNRALRALAETTETPDEVRLELNARTAAQQQKLVRRMQAEREQAELEVAKAELALAKQRARTEAALAKQVAREHADLAAQRARAEAEAERERNRAEAEIARREALAARDEAVAARAEARARAAASRDAAVARAAMASSAPALRRARARRRVRLAALGSGVAGAVVALSAATVVAVPALGWLGAAVVLGAVTVLVQMSRVQARATRRVDAIAATGAVRAERSASLQDVALAEERHEWTPRELPRPLASQTGSRAASVLDAAAAHDALRQAALEQAMRERAAEAAPVSIDRLRAARAAGRTPDDAEIEAHVRDLLARRAAV